VRAPCFFYEAKTTLQVSLTNTAEARLKINQLKKEESWFLTLQFWVATHGSVPKFGSVPV